MANRHVVDARCRVAMVMFSLCCLMVGCRPRYGLRQLSNTERAFATWDYRLGPEGHEWGDPEGTDEDGKSLYAPNGPFQLCLEYSTSAATLREVEAKMSVDVAEYVKAQTSVRTAESLAQIYTVTEIMQFGHAALYRLCEAMGNHDIQPSEYSVLVRDTLNNILELLRIQMASKTEGPMRKIVELKAEVLASRDSLEKVRKMAKEPELYRAAEQRHKEAVAKYEALVDAYGLQSLLDDLASGEKAEENSGGAESGEDAAAGEETSRPGTSQ